MAIAHRLQLGILAEAAFETERATGIELAALGRRDQVRRQPLDGPEPLMPVMMTRSAAARD